MEPALHKWLSLVPEDRSRLRRALEKGRLALGEMPGGASAWLAAQLAELTPPVIWVTDGPATLEVAWQDLQALGCGREAVRLPAWEGWPPEEQAEARGARQAALRRLAEGARLVVTCVQALMQKVPPPDYLSRTAFHLRVGAELDPEELVRWLVEAGYAIEAQVGARRELARRGGIVDFWPAEREEPVRAEFFGNRVESLRTFDPVTQRSRERLREMRVAPLAAWELIRAAGVSAPMVIGVEGRPVVLISDPEKVAEAAAVCEESAVEAAAMEYLVPWEALQEGWRRRGAVLVEMGEGAQMGADDVIRLEEVPHPVRQQRGYLEPDVAERLRRAVLEELVQRVQGGWRMVLIFDTPGGRERFEEVYGDLLPLPGAGRERLSFREGILSGGFVYPRGRTVVVAEGDLYGTPSDRVLRVPRRHRDRWRGAAARFRALESWSEIQPGDLVVHVEHGIGKYLGLYEIEMQGRRQEVLAVEYAGGSRLFVPVSQAHLLSRYIGVGRRRPELHRLRSGRWRRQKEAAQRSVADLAAQMLEVQALRETRRGHAFGPDTAWQREFEAAFPFPETEDQLRAVEDVKRDMESPRPMDRLICGDVGYGKTEVAMRAAFKAVMDGKQTAVLVPTTVLAQQHYDTFRQRMAAFPVVIEMLSRFRTEAQQRRILRDLAEGKVDIVIGTHRLLQPDVRFRDLGLVIIDEEQRFGVEHKERLKQMRALVDVLTMSATPIPRTLYLSLSGVRDMSIIETPPRERLPVETIVTEYSDEVVRSAILRELSREGQVYYLHNRVATIDRVVRRLRELVPEARIAAAHGQMEERELAEVMHRFVGRQIDVLVCTTIIESGVDIPNVNTILIDRADRFGIADLYQLRGRVGRYRHQAYAYLLLPRHGRLFATARRRIRTLQRHSSLGAGFRLALQDLEIRGAGNLLGREQSGHIAAVGFELYCQLLRRAVMRLRGEEPPPVAAVSMWLDFVDVSPRAGERAAAIPHDYLDDESLRLEMYRRLAAAATVQEIAELRREWRDRFGPLPPPVENLLLLAEVRVAAAERGIDTIQVRDDRVIIRRGEEVIKPGRRFPRLPPGPVEVRLRCLLGIVASCPVREEKESAHPASG